VPDLPDAPDVPEGARGPGGARGRDGSDRPGAHGGPDADATPDEMTDALTEALTEQSVIDPAAGREFGDDPSAMSAGKLQQRAVRGAAWTAMQTLIAIPIAFAVNLVVARVLGAADYGRLALLTALMEFVSSLLTTGFATAVIQFGAKAHAAGRRSDVARLLSQWQGFRLIFVMPVLAGVVLFSADVPVEAMVVAILFGVVLPSALDGGAACLGIENKTDDGAKIALVTTLATQAAVLVVALTARTPDAVWATRLIVGGTAVALCLFRISPEYRVAVLRPIFPRRMPDGFWRFAIPMGVAGVVGGLVSSRSEVFVMNWLATPAALGVYALAFGLAVHAFAPAQAIVGPLIPAISGLREVDEGAVRPAFRRVIRAGSTVVGGVEAAALAPLALLVPVLYGAEFADASPVVVALGVSAGLATVGGPVFAFVSARLSGRAILLANVAALVVDLVLAVALIPPLGVWGAVIANASGVLTSLTILSTRELRSLEIPAWTALRDALPAVLGSVVAVTLYAAASSLPGPALARAIGTAVVGAALYLGLVRLCRTGLSVGDAGAVLRVVPRRVHAPARLGVSLLSATRPTDEGASA
jgi:O-antigen/teichoic acid export membrane protein